MKTKPFQMPLDELGGFDEGATIALMVALKSSSFADDAASLLEAEFAKAPACGHCCAETLRK